MQIFWFAKRTLAVESKFSSCLIDNTLSLICVLDIRGNLKFFCWILIATYRWFYAISVTSYCTKKELKIS